MEMEKEKPVHALKTWMLPAHFWVLHAKHLETTWNRLNQTLLQIPKSIIPSLRPSTDPSTTCPTLTDIQVQRGEGESHRIGFCPVDKFRVEPQAKIALSVSLP